MPLYAEKRRFAQVKVPVLILGERGTGKSTLASCNHPGATLQRINQGTRQTKTAKTRIPCPPDKHTYQAYTGAILFTTPLTEVAIIGHPVKIACGIGDRRQVWAYCVESGRSAGATETDA